MATAEVPLGASLPASFREMREAGELVDVVLIFGHTRVPCHRVVLAGTCDYFRRMFLSNMIESDATEVKMEDISASIGLIIVKYLYSAEIDLNRENAQELLSASNMLLLDELKMRIEAFLVKEIDVLNCVDFLNLTHLYDLATLSGECRSFMRSHIDEITTEDVLSGLQEVDFVDLLTSAESHETRFSLLQKWTSSSDANKSRFMELMPNISLTQCGRQFVLEKVMSEQLMINPDGMKLVQDCLISGASLDAAEQHVRWIAVGDMKRGLWLCSDNEHWKKIKRPPITAEYYRHSTTTYSVCASPGGFILSGGIRTGINQCDCFSYNVKDKQWKTLPPMSIARANHSSIHNNHNLYVVGGFDGQSLDSVETLDLRSLQWTHLPSLPRACMFPSVLFVSNSLFVFGECDVHEYSSSEAAWRPRASVPEAGLGADVVCFKDQIFAVGGSKCCLRFNPRDNSWLSSLQRPQFRHFFGRSFVYKDKILLCGGDDEDSIEEYSPATDQWSTWKLKLPTKNSLRFALGE